MPRQTPDSDHHYNNGSNKGRRERDDYYDRYSKSHQVSHYSKESRSHRDRDRDLSSDDRKTQKYSRGRSRSRSTSRSRNSKKSSRRSRSRSRSHSNRRRSSSRSYDNKRRSRSRSYSRHLKRSRSRNSSRHLYHKTPIELNTKQSDTSQKYLVDSCEIKEEIGKNVENSKNYDNQRYTEMYSNINIPESDKSNDTNYGYYDEENDDTEYQNIDNYEPIDKEKIHREIEEKLRVTLAKEGKVYPPRKTEASHPIFANDGSFLEVFKKMQEQANNNQIEPKSDKIENAPISKPAPAPMISKRRGGRILKTGVVAKPSTRNPDNNDPKDFWALYLEEVKKYKNATCDVDGKTRPLVK